MVYKKYLLSEDNPLGKISHYFVRREYQGRGISHFHMTIWVDNAPTIGKDSDEDVAAFVQKFCTCQLPSSDNILCKYVKECQTHSCNPYCTRRVGKYGNHSTCRFKFPRPECAEFKLHGVAEATAARRSTRRTRLYELPRSSDEVCINDYNPGLLYIRKSNMDIQFIKEESCCVAHYIVKYQTKTEKSNIDMDFQTSIRSTTSTLYSLALRGISKREVGSIEAADANFAFFIAKTDRDTHIKWVNTSLDKKRRLKPKSFLQENPDSTDIFFPDDVNSRYSNRPDSMEDVCLYDYISNYDNVPLIQKQNPNVIPLKNDAGFIKCRSNPTLISHMRYDKLTKPEDYYRNLLLLFKPWREKIEVLVPYQLVMDRL